MGFKKFVAINFVSLFPIMGFYIYSFFRWELPYPTNFTIGIIGLTLIYAAAFLVSAAKLKEIKKNLFKFYITGAASTWLITASYVGVVTRDLKLTILGGVLLLLIFFGLVPAFIRLFNKKAFQALVDSKNS